MRTGYRQNRYIRNQNTGNKTMAQVFGILMIITGIATIGFTRNQSSVMDALTDESLYCEMVTLHKQDRTLGWPDYQGTYNKLCK